MGSGTVVCDRQVLAIGDVLDARRVHSRGAYRGAEYACELPGLLEQRGVFVELSVAKVLEPVDALVGFLEGHVKLGLELRP